jgi:hypothetical protein
MDPAESGHMRLYSLFTISKSPIVAKALMIER